MNGSIRLHPQYGVNPALGVCFWCGKEDGTVLLLGAASKEQHRHVCASYDFCDACKKLHEDNIRIIEVDTCDENKPTGRYLIVPPEALKPECLGGGHHVQKADILNFTAILKMVEPQTSETDS